MGLASHMIERQRQYLLLTPSMVPPSTPGMKVVGVFNPAAVDVGDQVYVLARVVEAPVEERPGRIGLPRWLPRGQGIEIDWLDAGQYIAIDTRAVEVAPDGFLRLTFTSHLRLFRFDREMKLLSPPEGELNFIPERESELYGVEDPRITVLDGWYYITYVAVSMHGACTALARTRDFKTIERLGIIFPPENKDVVLFPQKVGGRYAALHRPNPRMHFTRPEVWVAFSDNLRDWGDHTPLAVPNVQAWQSGRIGGGCPPVRTDRGWLVIYHGNDRVASLPTGAIGSYFGAAMLLDAADPSRVIGVAPAPILVPEQPYEVQGFVPRVVFPTAVLDRGDRWLIVYGAADENIAAAEVKKECLVELVHMRTTIS